MAGAFVFALALWAALVLGTYLLQAAIWLLMVTVRIGAFAAIAVLMAAGFAAAAVSAAHPRRGAATVAA